jgi:CheY-like chemotaxis protein
VYLITAIRDQVAALDALTEEYLAFARFPRPHFEEESINHLVQELAEFVQPVATHQGLVLSIRTDPDVPALEIDRGLLRQAILNLVKNALEVLSQGNEVTIESRRAGDTVEIVVSDTGPGLSDEVSKRLFEPFFTTKPQGVGTGVGLSVCHGIVAAHGGEIRLEPQQRPGATFLVRLPRTPAEAAEPAEAPVRRRRPARILVVDDEPEVGQMLIDILERDGYRVDRANSGREALSRLRTSKVDLILSDLRMPDLDGPALYRELEAQRPELLSRIVFMTGDTLGGDMSGFLTDTGVRVLEKPLDPAGVRAKIQGYLARRAGAAPVTSR